MEFDPLQKYMKEKVAIQVRGEEEKLEDVAPFKELPVIPVNKVVDEKEIIWKKGAKV
jgi:hypothetical protein